MNDQDATSAPSTGGTGPPRRFVGRSVLLTGAAGGIGRASARRLASEGAAVWCADIDGDGARRTAELVAADGGTAHAGAVDVTDPAACEALVAQAVADLGGLDVLANIAGIGGTAHTTDESPERFARILAVNAAGPFHMIRPALPHLLARRGNIVNLASTAGLIGQAYCAAYCASKHALVGLTRSLAIEYGRKGLRVNAVCPGGVDTELLGAFTPPEDASMSLVSRGFLVREMQQPDSVAAMVAYVASDEAYYVNGAVFAVDGGTTAG